MAGLTLVAAAVLPLAREQCPFLGYLTCCVLERCCSMKPSFNQIKTERVNGRNPPVSASWPFITI